MKSSASTRSDSCSSYYSVSPTTDDETASPFDEKGPDNFQDSEVKKSSVDSGIVAFLKSRTAEELWACNDDIPGSKQFEASREWLKFPVKTPQSPLKSLTKVTKLSSDQASSSIQTAFSEEFISLVEQPMGEAQKAPKVKSTPKKVAKVYNVQKFYNIKIVAWSSGNKCSPIVHQAAGWNGRYIYNRKSFSNHILQGINPKRDVENLIHLALNKIMSRPNGPVEVELKGVLNRNQKLGKPFEFEVSKGLHQLEIHNGKQNAHITIKPIGARFLYHFFFENTETFWQYSHLKNKN